MFERLVIRSVAFNRNGGLMNNLKILTGLLCVSGVSLSSLPAYANQQEVLVFTKMDADIADMWQYRDNIVTKFSQLGLLDEHDDHIHGSHDHGNEHGIGGDSDVDDIDVLASNDLLADKITELSDKSKHNHDNDDDVSTTAFDSKEDWSDLSAAIVKPKLDVFPEVQASSAHLLGIRPVANAKVTSKYGYRRIFGRSQFHKGIDLAAKYGSPIYATGAGKIVYAGWMRGYGRFIEIDHQNGYKTRYAHSARLRVKLGDMVTENQHIADLGCSGRCTGPHLHYEVKKNGKHMNPAVFLAMAPAG